MRKIIIVVLVLVLSMGCFCGCVDQSHGKSFETREEMIAFLTTEKVTSINPTYFPNADEKNAKWYYIANRSVEKQCYVGYKIYCFSAPFKTAIYSYNYIDEAKALCDDTGRLTVIEPITTSRLTIKLYTGGADADSIFIIGTAAIDGTQYECRIVGNEKENPDKTKNKIIFNGFLYGEAIAQLKLMFDGIAK